MAIMHESTLFMRFVNILDLLALRKYEYTRCYPKVRLIQITNGLVNDIAINGYMPPSPHINLKKCVGCKS